MAPAYYAYRRVLVVLFLVWWAALAIDPYDRRDWALENALVALAAPFIALSFRRLPLSRVSYTCIFLFLCLHTLGAHYTYSLVPYDAWMEALTGRTLNELFGLRRNHYDRLVHFAYGLLIFYPVREVFLRVAETRGAWGYLLPVNLLMSTSLAYELVEWAAALLFGGDLGVAFLGTQGDEWDAQKDMALATLGAVLAMAVTLAINAGLRRDFAHEWAESLRVKHPMPLGEEEIVRFLRQGD